MGVLYADLRNLVEHFRPVSEGKRVLTLGRLNVFLHSNEITSLRNLFAGDIAALSFFDTYRWGEYSERLFTDLFKCGTVESMDFSSYEGATHVQDIQQQIDKTLWGKYDLVFDGGTLEHVFNLPVALANAIRLATVGGLVYSNSPSNNLSGHGFYQFSPELLYRVMSRDNGMEVVLSRIGIARFPSVERTSKHRVYDVVDPASVGNRVRLLSSRPAYIMCMARKCAEIELFEKPVLQSDYGRKWSGAKLSGKRQKARYIFDRLPALLQHLVVGFWEVYETSPLTSPFYHRVW
jgi:hypothetical protein